MLGFNKVPPTTYGRRRRQILWRRIGSGGPAALGGREVLYVVREPFPKPPLTGWYGCRDT
jgi:hypothetical protein